MYRTLKNMLRRSSRKKGKVRWHSRMVDVEDDVCEAIESSHRQDNTYPSVSEDFCGLGDGADSGTSDRCSNLSTAIRFSTVAEVHVTENVAPVTAPNISPKLSPNFLTCIPQETMEKAAATAPVDRTPSSKSTSSVTKVSNFSTPRSANVTTAGSSSTPTVATPTVVATTENPSFDRVADFFHQFSDLRTDVRIMMANKSLIYLLGTNHADPQCPLDVADIIRKVGPQLVIIELCAWRACGCDLHRGNVFQTKPEFTFRYLRKVISQIGFLPAMIFFTDAFNEHNAVTGQLLDYGGEFAVAARLCEELGDCKILLGDREIPITVKRQASGMGNWRGIRISVLVTLALIFKRRMKTLLLRGHRLVIRDPRFYQVVVLERDIFLTYMIQVASAIKFDVEQPQIVAVVGQGHLNGIQRFWGRILPQILPLILKPDVDF